MEKPRRSQPAQPVRARASRRKFLKQTALATGAFAFPEFIPASALGKDGTVAPSNRVTLGTIGTGNQGMNDLRNFVRDSRVQVIAVCDVNRESPGYWDGKVAGREIGRKFVTDHYAKQKPSGKHRGVAAYEDFRELLARSDLDAVHVATPDHWHALPVILAAQAKKDLYCQKPLSLTIAEGRAMSDAVSKCEIIFQTGSQQRSDSRFRLASELARNGYLGRIHTVKCGQPSGHPDFGRTGDRKAPAPVPEGFDYNMWLGPAPDAPYSPARCHVNFRWNFDYSGGQVTDWGGHHPDIAQWGLGTMLTGPVAIRNARGILPPRDALWNTAEHYWFEGHYENGAKIIISDQFPNGVRFEGTDGWVFVQRGGIEASNPDLLKTEFRAADQRLYVSENHYTNFIDCVLARKETVAPCEQAHRSITICHLGNIAMQLGRDLKWDPKREQIIGDTAANAMLNRPYRAPWKLPVV